MSNFIKYRLGDECIVINGKAYKQEELLESGKYRVLRVGNFFSNGSWYYSNLELDEEKYCQNGDLLFAWSASFGPKIWKEDKTIYHYHIWKLKENEQKIDKVYLYYYLKNITHSMLGSTHGSIMLHLTKVYMEDLVINVPKNVKEQNLIASVLSALDSKIELNNRINAELETMAKTIYDYWFVQFDFPDKNGKPYKTSGGKMVWNEELKREVPEGWEVKELGMIGNFKNGVNYDPSNPGEIPCPIINVRNISSSRFFLKNEDLDVIYLRESDVRKYSVHAGSIIIARSGIPGATRLISDIAENTLYCGFAIHYELEELNLKIPVFFFLKSIEQQIQSGSGGTILKNVNQATLNVLKITLPKNENVIKEFNNKIEPLFGKINLIQKENQKLTELRDWLLPMLMNGQVRVD